MEGSVTRSGGYALIAGAVFYAVGVFIHPDVGAADALTGSSWALAHWFLAFGAFFLLSGFIAALRAWGGSDSESWAIMAVAGAITGTVLILASAAPEFAGQHGMAGETGGALLVSADVAAGMGRGMSWIAVAALGMAALKAAWPAWVGWAGVVIGLLEFVGEFVVDVFATQRLVWLIGLLWLMVAGYQMAKASGGATAEARPASPGTYTGGPGVPTG